MKSRNTNHHYATRQDLWQAVINERNLFPEIGSKGSLAISYKIYEKPRQIFPLID